MYTVSSGIDTLSRKVTFKIVFASLLKTGLLQKERICSPPFGSKFFPFRVDLFPDAEKQIGSHKKLSPMYQVYPVTLRWMDKVSGEIALMRI